MTRSPWSAEDLLRLEEMITRGRSDVQIGCALGRTPVAVQVIRKRKGILCRRQAILSARAVARKLGLSCSKTVVWWIHAGYLRGRRGQGAGPNRMWYVTEEALLDFLADDGYWHLWDPVRVDSALRLWIVDMRKGDRFLTTGQAGAILGVGHGAVNSYIKRGLLPGVRRGNWLVEEADLAGFELPCNRSQRGIRPRRFRPEEDELLLRLRGEGERLTVIARTLGRAVGSVNGRLLRLAQAGAA